MKLILIVLLIITSATSGLSQSFTPIPARIEAENFFASSGVTPSLANEESSSQIGWMNDSTWMDYPVSVPVAGFYVLNFRIANGFSSNATIRLSGSGGNVVGQMLLPHTGGMNSWKTVSMFVNLPSGNQTLRVFIVHGVFSLNWFELSQNLKNIPGKIEAESFDLASAVSTENTSDTGGGLNVGQIDDGDWLDYNVQVPVEADYTCKFRVANAYGNGIIQIRDLNENILSSVNVPQTGGWQNWTTITTSSFHLPAGNQILRLHMPKGTFNLNWLEFLPQQTPTELNFAALPNRSISEGSFTLSAGSNNIETPLVFTSSDTTIVKIQNNGGVWTATPQSAGTVQITVSQVAGVFFPAASASRSLTITPAVFYQTLPGVVQAESFFASSGLSAGNTSDINGNQEVGWIADNNWLDYHVNVNQSGYYLFSFRVANGFSSNASLAVQSANDSVLAQIPIPHTGGMNAWKTTSALVYLTAGNQNLRIYISKGVFSINWFEASQNIKNIPGRVEAENFDLASQVTTETSSDPDNGINVASIDDNDWMDYIVTVANAGSHVFNFRFANAYGYGVIQIKNTDGQILGQVSLPQTGGWQSWQTISTTATLPTGNQVLRIFAQRGAFNLNWMEVSEGTLPTSASVIDFSQPTNMYVGGSPLLLQATSNNTERPVTFTSSDSTILSVKPVSGNWIATPLAPGNVTITASQSSSSNYLAAADVSRNITVFTGSVSNAPKISLDPNRWYVLNNVSSSLQALHDGITDTNVQLGWGLVLDDFDAYYPLLDGETMSLEKVKMFDFVGIFTDKPMTLSVINSQWQRIPVATFTGDKYNTWVGPYPGRNTQGEAQFDLDSTINDIRYLVLNIKSGMPTELELYGTHNESTTPVPGFGNPTIRLKDMLGVNAYEWNFQDAQTPWQLNEDKIEMVRSFSGIRHYIDWQKLESSEGVYSYNPTLSGGWHYDQIYERCKLEGIDVLACIKSLPNWMVESYPIALREHENVPVLYGADFSQPSSYIQQAKIGFQFAARYGSNTSVNPSLLSVYETPRWPGDNPNTIKIGTGLINYIECDNERDKWWKGRQGYQTAREYAANLSAFYDGHKNSMGSGVGVKNADPNMKVVIAGLVSGPEYVRAMVDWCKEFRGYKASGEVDLCWDVINYHIYTDNTSSSQSGTSTRGAAVETTNAHIRTDEFVRVANELCYNMPVWITEAGFDIHQNSPLKAIPIGNKTALDTQADWILRMSLFSARHGIEKVFYYQMYDDNDWGGIFGSSGLVNSNLTRRPTADFFHQTRTQFGEFVYKQTLSQFPFVDRYQLNGDNLYALAMPTEDGSTSTYNLTVSGFSKVKVFTPTAGADSMSVQVLDVVNNLAELLVSETPIFVQPYNPSAQRRLALADSVQVNNPEKSGAALSEKPAQILHETVIVYPNFTTGFVTVDPGNTLNDDLHVRVIDAKLGRLQKTVRLRRNAEVSESQISVSDLPDGTYVLEIRQNDTIAYRKIIKGH